MSAGDSVKKGEARQTALAFYETWIKTHQCQHGLLAPAKFCYAEFAEAYAAELKEPIHQTKESERTVFDKWWKSTHLDLDHSENWGAWQAWQARAELSNALPTQDDAEIAPAGEGKLRLKVDPRGEANALPSQLDFEVKTICQSIGEGYISTEEAKGYVRKAFAQGYLAAGYSPSQLERAARRIVKFVEDQRSVRAPVTIEHVREILRSELGEDESLPCVCGRFQDAHPLPDCPTFRLGEAESPRQPSPDKLKEIAKRWGAFTEFDITESRWRPIFFKEFMAALKEVAALREAEHPNPAPKEQE